MSTWNRIDALLRDRARILARLRRALRETARVPQTCDRWEARS